MKDKAYQKHGYISPQFLTNGLFGLTLLIVMFFNIFSFLQVSRLANANKWVTHTYQVINAVNAGFLDLVQVESSARGFILTQNKKILEGMDVSILEMYQNFMVAKKLTLDNPLQQRKLEILTPLLKDRIQLIKQIVALELADDAPARKESYVALVNQGSELSNKISMLIKDISYRELNLLEQRNLFSVYHLNELNHILLFTSFLSVLFFIAGIVILNVNLAKQRKFSHEKQKYENLLKGVIEGTSDIIAVLDLNFRLMIFNQSFEHEFKALYGVRPRLGANIFDLIAHLPHDQKKILEPWTRALNGEEFNIIGEFGSTNYQQNFYECNFNSVYDETGSMIGAAGICRNIEHRIQAEKAQSSINDKLESAYHELKQHDSEVSLLNEMEMSLQSCATIEETVAIINRYCQKLLSFASGIIYLINPSRNYLEETIRWNAIEEPGKVFSPRQCWGLRQGKNYFYIKNSASVRCEHLHHEDPASYLCIPLLAQNEVIGLMHIVSHHPANLSESEIRAIYERHGLLINNLAVQLALAITNIQLRETLKNRSVRDHLTGLYNRTYLSEFLSRDLERSQRNNAFVSIVMMDIDCFKTLNDKYGHDAGDMTLKEIGKLLHDNVRSSDIVCRYGGEEFLLIFYETDKVTATKRIEKIRLLINQMEVKMRGGTLDKITASFGLAVFPENGTTAETLITAADHALFVSKKNGRNQLTIYNKER